jgi:hypothetical protein
MDYDINMMDINNTDKFLLDGHVRDIGTQTEIIKQNVESDQHIIKDFMNTRKGFGGFRHLVFANQTYWQHFCDSFGYFKTSLRAAFYFLSHAFWPDIFEQSGSKTISELNDKIRTKYVKRILEIKAEMSNN